MDPFIIGALIITGGSILSSVTRKEEPRFHRPASDKFFEERVESARKIGAKRKATIALASSISGVPVEEFHIGSGKVGMEEGVVKRSGGIIPSGEGEKVSQKEQHRIEAEELSSQMMGKPAVGKPSAKESPVEPLKKAVMGDKKEKEKEKKNIFEKEEI